MNSGLLGFPNILGLLRATAFKATGKSGATNGAALAGGTASGAPVAPAGPFDVGDLIVSQSDGAVWICTVAGTSQSSPGTFTQVIAGSVSGQLSVAHGGTGIDASSAANGQLLIGTGSGLSLATLTPGANVTISNAAGGITIAASSTLSGGTVPSVRCYNSGALSIANNTAVALTFDTNRWDQGPSAQHSTSSNTSRLTCQVAGVYAIWGGARMSFNATAHRELDIRLNGTTFIAVYGTAAETAGSQDQYLQTSTQYQLAVGDYVELIAFQSSGATLTVTANANYSPEFAMTRVA